MRLIALADIHLTDKNFGCRADNVVETQIEKLESLLDFIKNNDEEVELVVAGDLFDKPRSWFLLPKIINLLDDYLDQPVLAVFGQHDTYLYSEGTRSNTSLGVLEAAGFVKILNETPMVSTSEKTSVNYYGCSFGQEIPEPKDPKAFNILVIHANISDIELNPNQEYRKANIFLRDQSKYNLIICGDQHRTFSKKEKERLIVNSGPMIRKTSDLFLHEPGYWIIDINGKKINHQWATLPFEHHDNCIRVAGRETERATSSIDMMDEFISSIKEVQEKGTDFLAILQNFLEAFDGGENVKEILSSMLMEKMK